MEPTTVVLPRPRSRSAGLALHRTVTMTAGAELPLRALQEAPIGVLVSCHPCDEAIVRYLVGHVGRPDCSLRVDPAVDPGVLALGVRLRVAS
jgi:hypothetical protein